jgi:hypothetical protein
MRVLLGIILGAALTVGGAYLYDSHNALQTGNVVAAAPRPMVNWDVVEVKWQHAVDRAQHLTRRAKDELTRIAGR